LPDCAAHGPTPDRFGHATVSDNGSRSAILMLVGARRFIQPQNRVRASICPEKPPGHIDRSTGRCKAFPSPGRGAGNPAKSTHCGPIVADLDGRSGRTHVRSSRGIFRKIARFGPGAITDFPAQKCDKAKLRERLGLRPT
jgi:hypothetical protein